MTDPAELSNRYAPIIVTGILSLIVGVTGGLTVNYFTQHQPGLEYDLVTSAVFSGERERIAILGITVRNPATKEVEDLRGLVSFKNAKILEPKVVGLQAGAYTTNVTEHRFEIEAQFLNPGEQFSILLLVTSPEAQLESPSISVRGKGITATQRAQVGEEKREFLEILPLVAAATLAPLPFILRLFFPGFLFTRRHRDDQRDVMAFVLGAHEFYEQAQTTRSVERKLSYWSESDRLAEYCLLSGGPDTMRRGVRCLQHLLEYASMAETSELLVHFNIARLAARAGDKALAREHLTTARKGNHRVIDRRISFDEELARLVELEQGTA